MEKKRIESSLAVGTFRKKPASQGGEGITLKEYVKMWMGGIVAANMRSSSALYYRLNLSPAFYRSRRIEN
jgi:hypothetical protein